MSEWKPIETAPKDGRWLLLFCDFRDRKEVRVARWVRDDRGHSYELPFGPFNWACQDDVRMGTIARDIPTHWQPLPPSPNTEEVPSQEKLQDSLPLAANKAGEASPMALQPINSQVRETIVASAICNGPLTFSMKAPARHGDLIQFLDGRWGVVQPDQQGFITSTGRYVDRAAARKIAEKAGQLLPDKPWQSNSLELFSEDVW